MHLGLQADIVFLLGLNPGFYEIVEFWVEFYDSSHEKELDEHGSSSILGKGKSGVLDYWSKLFSSRLLKGDASPWLWSV